MLQVLNLAVELFISISTAVTSLLLQMLHLLLELGQLLVFLLQTLTERLPQRLNDTGVGRQRWCWYPSLIPIYKIYLLLRDKISI